MGPNLVDKIDCGNFFDQIDDLIEFPPENECGGGGGGGVGNFVGDYDDFPSMWSNALLDSDPFFSDGGPASQLSFPYEDIEWLPVFMEDSFSGGETTTGKEKNSCNNFQTASPVSVLESSSSSSSETNPKPLSPNPSHRGPQRARTKRPRPASFNPRAAIQLISRSPSAESSLELVPTGFSSENLVGKKKKKKTTKIEITPRKAREEKPQPQQAIRKCMHCEITKTPQWRAGPMGPKSLCNACGVRYKSGRLFPEYRPAASPTFVPSLHSNSHKKVAEMRNKLEPTTTTPNP